jgi:segregation and condensation protein B
LHSASVRYAGPLARLAEPGRPGPSVELGAPKGYRASGPGASQGAAQARDAALVRLEAVLFLAREPITSRKLSQYANLADGTQARTLVRRLNEHYDGAGRSFRVEQVAGGYQLLSRRKFAPWLRRLAHVPAETRLSAPALETLAVIAYRQPVPRADIEAIRGVNCGEILRQLMERDLVRIGGRSDELGRPYLYSTTKRFLHVFGLVHLDDLPRREELRACPLPVAPSPTFAESKPQVLAPEMEVETPAKDDDIPDDTADVAGHEYNPR